MSPTIPCDVCGARVDRAGREGVKVSHSVRDSDGGALVVAQTYFYGHSDCVRRIYRSLGARVLGNFRPVLANVRDDEAREL